jgi:hypothetical protein
MKIYIEKYKLSDIHILDNLIISKKKRIDIYSSEGIFCVDNKQLFKLNITDKKTIKIENYFKGQTIIIDDSIITKEINYQIPTVHVSLCVTTFIYKINNKSNVSFVVEGVYDQDKIYEQRDNIYDGFTITDYYFRSSSIINDIKDNLCEFLSILN